MDIYFCPFFQTPTTFGQNFLPFSAFGDFTNFNTFLIKNSNVFIFVIFTEDKLITIITNINIIVVIILGKMRLLFLFVFVQVVSAINYLTSNQWSYIKYILKHPQRTNYMVETINQVLYQHYRYKAHNIAYEFKSKYSVLCRHISITELNQYASKGLLMAIKNYNPKYPFANHMSLYVNSQLYVGLSKLQPLTIIPKHLRLSKKWKNENKILYKRLTSTKLVGNDNYLYDLIEQTKKNKMNHLENNSKSQMLIEIWSIIKSLDIESQKIMKYKYNFYLEKQRTNTHVAELMCCSDETIRKKLLIIQNIIQKECKKL